MTSFAQIAYEAFIAARKEYTDNELPAWIDLPEYMQQVWEVAVQTIINYTVEK